MPYEIESLPLMLKLVILSFAVWRVSSIIHRESIFEKARFFLGVVETDHQVIYPDNFVGKLLGCMKCLSVWISFIFVVGYFFLPSITTTIAIVFALSTVAILIEKATKVTIYVTNNTIGTSAG